jgi:hypothetical protein
MAFGTARSFVDESRWLVEIKRFAHSNRAQIPKIAPQIARKLGAPKPRIPTKSRFLAAELDFGTFAAASGLSSVNFGRRRKLVENFDGSRCARRNYRAAFGNFSLPQAGNRRHQFSASSAGQRACVGEIAYMDAARLMQLQPGFTRVTTKFPRNYLLAQAQMRWEKRQSSTRVAGETRGNGSARRAGKFGGVARFTLRALRRVAVDSARTLCS